MGTRKDVVFFDAGGTLFEPYPSVGHIYAQTAAWHGVIVDGDQVEKEFHRAWRKRNDVAAMGRTSEKIERDWWYALVRDVFGNLQEFKNFDQFFEELYDLFAQAKCWRLFDDTLSALKQLQSEGFRLGIISNWDQRLFSIVDQLKLNPFFEHVVASSVVGVAKPGGKIFQEALSLMKIKGAQALHVGDSVEDDYHGARLAGLEAVLINRRGKAYNGVVSIPSLNDVVAIAAGTKTL